jgi:hypothetical protein
VKPPRRPWWLLAPLALAACGTLGSSARHVDPLPAAEAPPWLAPVLADPGQRSPLQTPH